ncbi:MAG: hypothetical protein E6Q68_06455 [Polynucleobacter sp.]|nr:MAG: hypothetical protein E6Q68_06455 [Polynucleobacter sp.]
MAETTIPKLAIPTFISKPDTKLASLDVYKKGAASSINEFKSILDNITSSLTETLRGGFFDKALSSLKDNLGKLGGLSGMFGKLGALGGQFSSMIGGLKGMKLDINIGGMLARALGGTSVMGKLGSLVNSMGPNLKGLESSLKNFIGSSNIIGTLNGVKSFVSSFKFDSLSSLGKALETITGGALGLNINDIQSKVKMFSGLIKDAISLGVGGVFGGLMATVSDNKVVSGVLSDILGFIIGKSDWRTLADIANDPLASTMIKGKLPGTVAQFAANFRLDEQYRGKNAIEIGKSILDSFAKINPSWAIKKRVGYAETWNAVNISEIAQGSADFIMVITKAIKEGGAGINPYMGLINGFRSGSVPRSLNRDFPLTVVNVIGYSSPLDTTVTP